MTIFDKILPRKITDNPDILDSHLVLPEMGFVVGDYEQESLLSKHKEFVAQLQEEYKYVLEKISFARLEKLLPSFVLMHALKMDEETFANFLSKLKESESTILRDVGFKDASLALFSLSKGKKEQDKNNLDNFNKVLEELFDFVLIDACKEILEKVEIEKLKTLVKNRTYLEKYMYELVTENSFTNHTKILAQIDAARDKIFLGYKKYIG